MPVNKRNISVWKPLTTLAYMGVPNPLLDNGTVLDNLGQSLIGGAVTIVDDATRIKEEQRDALVKLGYDTITNQMTLADMNATTRRSVMALEIAANNYIMLVENYIIEVLNLITDAKEYAFELGKNAIDLAQVKAEIAEEKGAIYIQKVDLQIELEEIERKHVEIELLRAELSVAKAHTRLLMAEIEVSRAELALIEVNVKAAMANLAKIQIEVDIAMTIADIIVRGLTTVKYEVEVAEIAASFGIIGSKLSAVLSLIAEKGVQLGIQTESKETIFGDITDLNAANIEAQSKRIDEVNSNQSVHEHEASKIADVLSEEEAQISALTEQIINEIEARTIALVQTEEMQTWASELIDAAYIVARARFSKLISQIHLGQDVHPNSSVFCG